MGRVEQVMIYGTLYDIDVDSVKITITNNGLMAYAAYDAWDNLMQEHVKIHYISVNYSIPEPQYPYRIERPERVGE